MWCIGTMTGEYLANLEDVLDVYAQPAEAGVVRLCFDERPCQLFDQVLTSIPPKPGERLLLKLFRKSIFLSVCHPELAKDLTTASCWR